MIEVEKNIYGHYIVNDKFLKEFGKRYTELKSVGYMPSGIKKIITDELGVCDSRYYEYLRRARKRNIVTDSYEENKINQKERDSFLRETIIDAIMKVLKKDPNTIMLTNVQPISISGDNIYNNEIEVDFKSQKCNSPEVDRLYNNIIDRLKGEK